MLETKTQLTEVAQPKRLDQEPIHLALNLNDLTIVLPVLNEEKGVSAVIDELHEKGYTNILVIDGYSTDSTVQEARKRGVTVIEQHGRGKTGAIQTAIENVKTPYMLVMDGDYTYDPDSIQRFLTHVNGYDQIVGARSVENISWMHRFGNRLLCGVFNMLFGTGFSDVCSGMYLLNTKGARELDFRTRGFSVEAEVLAQMSMRGMVTEVPIHYRKRIGKPKLSTLVHGFDILKSILLLARKHNPVFVFSIIAATAAVPGGIILAWVLWQWTLSGVTHSGWALAGGMLLLFATQAFIAATIALILKHMQFRMEHLFRFS